MSDGHDSLRKARDLLIEHRLDYRRACQEFRWPSFTHFNFAFDWFDAVASRRGGCALRILNDDGSVEERSYPELARRSAQAANLLRAAGVRRGDTILVMLGNRAALWEVLLAAIRLGAVVIPTTTLLSRDDLRDRLERGRARAVVAGVETIDRFPAAPAGGRIAVAVGPGAGHPDWIGYEAAQSQPATFVPEGPTRADDPLLLYFTSGTTSRPKLALHSHVSYPVGHLSTMYWIGLEPGDRHLNISSPGWAKHAWSSVFAPWLAEATVLVLNHARFDARATLDAIVRERVTTFCAPPTVWRMLIQQDLASWRTELRELVGAGEPLNPEVIERVRGAWQLVVRDGYGQTETTAQVGNCPGQPVVPGTMGRPLPGYLLSVRDAAGAPTDEGEICLELGASRPLGLMRGYNVDGALEPLTGPLYRTGDTARQDAAGLLTYVGRADDVFKASDYRISPFELESALIEHPSVAEAAVVPSPDALRMAVPKAFVALAPGAVACAETARSILEHGRKVLGPFKRVRRVEFCELPKTVSGKIRRVELRRQEAARRAAGERGALEWTEEDFAGPAGR